MIAFTLFMPLPMLAGSVPLFFAALFVFGTTIGALDVSMNVQATEVEAARGKPTMSSFHGFFSLGALLGAGLGAAIIAAGLGDGRGAALAGAVFFLVAILATLQPVAERPGQPMPGRISPCPTAPPSPSAC